MTKRTGKSTVSRTEFAEMVGVSRSAVYQAAGQGRPLSAAVVDGRIDPEHPAAVAYLSRKPRGSSPAGPVSSAGSVGHVAANERRKAAESETRSSDDDLARLAVDIRALADKSLRELVEVFGTDIRFIDWLKALKEIESISEKRLKNATLEGELVTRERVRRGVLEPLDTAFRLLLTDGAKVVAVKARAMVEGGRSDEELEAFVRERLGSFIRPAKAKMTRGLRDA